MDNRVMVEANCKVVFGISDDTECCYNCEHYWQHYVLQPCKQKYAIISEITDGHCCYPRMKSRQPMDFCRHFERRERYEEVDAKQMYGEVKRNGTGMDSQ